MRTAPSFFRLKKRNNQISPNDQQFNVDNEKKVEMRNIKRQQQTLLTDHLRARPLAIELPEPQI